MLSREEFLNLIEFMQQQEAKQETFIKALDVLSPDTYNDCFIFTDYENEIIALIEKILYDTEDELGYYLYDMGGLIQPIDYEYSEDECPKDSNGNVLYNSLSSLYDYLVNNNVPSWWKEDKKDNSTTYENKGQLYFDFDTNEFKEVL